MGARPLTGEGAMAPLPPLELPLHTVDRRPSPVDHTQRPPLCTARWAIGRDVARRAGQSASAETILSCLEAGGGSQFAKWIQAGLAQSNTRRDTSLIWGGQL